MEQQTDTAASGMEPSSQEGHSSGLRPSLRRANSLKPAPPPPIIDTGDTNYRIKAMNNEDTGSVITAFHDGLITRERMTALTEEARLREWVIGQVNAMDARELARVVDFIKDLTSEDDF
jgi:hypothetical protein